MGGTAHPRYHPPQALPSSSPTILSPQCEREGPWEGAIPGALPPQASSDQGLEAAKCLMSSCGHSKSGHFVPPERPPASRRRKLAPRPQAGERPPMAAVPVTGSRAINNQSVGPKSFRGSREASVGAWQGGGLHVARSLAGGWGRGDLPGVTAGPPGLLRDTWNPASVPRVRSRTPDRGRDVGWGPALSQAGTAGQAARFIN